MYITVPSVKPPIRSPRNRPHTLRRRFSEPHPLDNGIGRQAFDFRDFFFAFCCDVRPESLCFLLPCRGGIFSCSFPPAVLRGQPLLHPSPDTQRMIQKATNPGSKRGPDEPGNASFSALLVFRSLSYLLAV